MDPATITFRVNSAPEVGSDRPIRAGAPLVIRYDPERVGPRSRYWGMNGAEVYIRFHPSGNFVCEHLYSRNEQDRYLETRRFALPMDARRLEIWARVIWYVKYGDAAERWDSDYERNFWFDVAPWTW